MMKNLRQLLASLDSASFVGKAEIAAQCRDYCRDLRADKPVSFRPSVGNSPVAPTGDVFGLEKTE